MVPVSQLFLTEGVWSFMKNSIASILGRRKSTSNIKNDSSDDEEKLQRSEATQKRLTPRPLAATREHLGFKAKIKK